jgi:hypothetical protein
LIPYFSVYSMANDLVQGRFTLSKRHTNLTLLICNSHRLRKK